MTNFQYWWKELPLVLSSLSGMFTAAGITINIAIAAYNTLKTRKLAKGVNGRMDEMLDLKYQQGITHGKEQATDSAQNTQTPGSGT